MFGKESMVSLALASCLIAGCGAGAKKDSTTIDVRGVVVSEAGLPVAGATVGIPGVGSTSTAADGSFALAGVTPPYDIGVSMPSSGMAFFYQSVRSATPRVPLQLLGASPVKQVGYVSGTITGGESYPQLPNHRTQVCLEADTTFGQAPSTVSSTGAYTAELAWGDSTTIAAKLRGMQTIVDPATGAPISYTALGIDDVTVTAGTIANKGLGLIGVGQATLTGTATLPPGYVLSGKSLSWGCLDLVDDGGAATSFSYSTPDGVGANLMLEIRAQSGEAEATTRRSRLLPDATAVSVAVPAAPVPVSPSANATGVDASTAVFSWSGTTQGVYVFALKDAAAYPDLATLLVVVTPATSMRLPDSALVGVSVPRGAALAWEVGTVAPTTMEDIVGRGTLVPSSSSVSETSSGDRFLSTAP
jgi:hypothetical protein